LRVLAGGEVVDFVPEVKFGHWAIVRLEHQLGWVNLNNVEIIEDVAPVVDPMQFLEEPPPPERPIHEIEETMISRPRELDARVRANIEREYTSPQPELDATEPTAPAKGVGAGDLRRLIRFVTGKLTGTRRHDETP
jgi:hypothetical protein